MARQLHKIFTDDDVKSLLNRYISKEVKIDYILDVLGIKRSRFFESLRFIRRILWIFLSPRQSRNEYIYN